MGIAAYFRQIKEEVIAEAEAKAEAKGRAEGIAKGTAEAKAEGISEGRELAISELRAMPRHEALALLERQDTNTDPDAEPNSASPPAANGQPPPAV